MKIFDFYKYYFIERDTKSKPSMSQFFKFSTTSSISFMCFFLTTKEGILSFIYNKCFTDLFFLFLQISLKSKINAPALQVYRVA